MLFLEWEVGQTRTVMFGPFSLDVEITGVTQGEISRTIYFHRADLSEAVGLQTTTVLLQLPEGVELDNEIGELSIGITQKQDMIEAFDSLMEQQQQFYNAILLLGFIIAIAVLFNTLLMNLSERDSELATLRVLGAPIRRIGTMLLGEHFDRQVALRLGVLIIGRLVRRQVEQRDQRADAKGHQPDGAHGHEGEKRKG